MHGCGAELPERIAAWARRGYRIVTGVLLGAGVVAVVATPDGRPDKAAVYWS